MTSIDGRNVEDVRLGGVRTPRTVDPLAALLGGVAGGLFLIVVWLTPVPIQAVFLEGIPAGVVAGSVNTDTKLPALDGAAATVVGAVIGLLGVCTWLVVNLSLSTGLEVELFLSLFAPGVGVIILTVPLAALPAALLATVVYRVRRMLGWL